VGVVDGGSLSVPFLSKFILSSGGARYSIRQLKDLLKMKVLFLALVSLLMLEAQAHGSCGTHDATDEQMISAARTVEARARDVSLLPQQTTPMRVPVVFHLIQKTGGATMATDTQLADT
jgi:hypothetical protein